jgi:hypothetical protein
MHLTYRALEGSSCGHQRVLNFGAEDRRLAPKGDKVAGIPTLGPGVPCIYPSKLWTPTSLNIAHSRGWNDPLSGQARVGKATLLPETPASIWESWL